jgi:pyrroloquinoline quinone (PQQ) biosynthesis protein C
VDEIWAREQEQFPVKRPPRPRQRQSRLPRLTVDQILAWADAHHAATGKWPMASSARVRDASYPVSWCGINKALYRGRRGLPGNSSLSRLLAENRELRTPLTVEKIIAWADRYNAAHDRWPTPSEPPKEAAPGETWPMIDRALRYGLRGLPGGSTLFRLLVAHRGPEVSRRPPQLTLEQILAWADAHHAATGKWPTRDSGVVSAAPDEHWEKLDTALRQEHRGLSGSTSLARVLARHRGVPNRLDVPRLSVGQILSWADAHRAATGKWPKATSGVVRTAPADTWAKIELALRQEGRGLRGKTSLARLLAEHRGAAKE